jgi:hypothetical protein
VHTPERPLEESPVWHQLVWTTKKALEDCNCSKFEPGLSPNKQPLFESSCSIRYLLCTHRPSKICYVQLSTSGSCSSELCNLVLWALCEYSGMLKKLKIAGGGNTKATHAFLLSKTTLVPACKKNSAITKRNI